MTGKSVIGLTDDDLREFLQPHRCASGRRGSEWPEWVDRLLLLARDPVEGDPVPWRKVIDILEERGVFRRSEDTLRDRYRALKKMVQ